MAAPGAQPDLLGSPEVLTWMWMLILPGRGEEGEVIVVEGDEERDERYSPRYLSRSWAFFSVSMLETLKRLGILARDLQWPGGVSKGSLMSVIDK